MNPSLISTVFYRTVPGGQTDGMSHADTLESDTARAQWLAEQGYRLLRVTNRDVVDDLEAVARYVAREAGVTWEG
jgi:very-short-patch-repair endonuclease